MNGRRFAWALMLFLAASPAVFGEEVFSSPLTEAAKPRFLSLCAELSARPAIRGSFELRRAVKKLDRVMVSSGNFIISAEHGIIWDTKKPFPSTMTMGRDFIRQTTPEGSGSVLSAQGNETFLRFSEVMRALFAGDPVKLFSGFQVFFAESPGYWELGLIPRDAAIRGFIERIALIGEGGLIRGITIFQRNGDAVSYAFSGQRFEGLSPQERELFNGD